MVSSAAVAEQRRGVRSAEQSVSHAYLWATHIFFTITLREGRGIMEAYKILRIINNNVVFSVNERGDEIILRGKGIGFQKRPE